MFGHTNKTLTYVNNYDNKNQKKMEEEKKNDLPHVTIIRDFSEDDQGFLDEIVCISRIASKYLFLRAKVLLYGYGVARRPNTTNTNSSLFGMRRR